MIAMTLAEIASAVGGRLAGSADGDRMVTGTVEHDSRKVRDGGLFVAIPGERVDGHDFAAAAHAAGAVAVLATRPVPVPSILVDDVLVALGRLARAVVDRLPGMTIVGITGSSGKTSTKDLVAQLCRNMGETVATEGNFNNELGHPYTVCRATESTRYLVLEMGARGIGHITRLCAVAPPGIGAVLNVGLSHLDGFGDIDTTARAKSELATAVPPDGVVVLNADDPRVTAMRSVARGTVVTFGHGPTADVRATDIGHDAGRPTFTLHTPEGAAPVRMRLHGAHHIGNALAAAAIAWQLGASAADIAVGLGRATRQSARRMDVFTRHDGITVIDDSYNANPASMAAALSGLTDIATGRRIAVLGYMADLMELEDRAHQEVGRKAVEAGVDTLVVVDPLASPIGTGAADSDVTVVTCADQAEAITALRGILQPGDTVLVKASRYRTWQVADYLREDQVLTEESGS